MSDQVYALDLDEELLSHLPDPDAWVVIQGEDVTDDLIEDDFVAEVFAWQKRHLREHHQPATASVLEDQFPDLDLAPPETAIGDLLDRLRERFAKNRGRDALREIIDLQWVDPTAVPAALLSKGRELGQILTHRGEVWGNGDIDRALRRYDQKVKAGPGASFGHDALDEFFYGMGHGLYFMIAPPKTYKSWQLIQSAMANVMNGVAVAHYSLELPAQETFMRMQHMVAGIPWWHYTRNAISQEERKLLADASQLLDECGVYKIAKPPEGKRGIDDIVYQARDAGAQIVLIDQLQYVEARDGLPLGTHNKTGEYWDVLNRARDLSDDGPIVIAHQFNRSTMFSDSMPSMEQIKGSSAVEETATLALGMWANKDMRRSSMLEIGVLCARNYQYAAWEMSVELSRGCEFQITRRKEDDE